MDDNYAAAHKELNSAIAAAVSQFNQSTGGEVTKIEVHGAAMLIRPLSFEGGGLSASEPHQGVDLIG